MIGCYFRDVSEHDMDLLILEEFVYSKEFLGIFTSPVGVKNPKVVSTYASKTDPVFGETDILVIVESEGERIGLLIEDKIDAMAMPEQSSRYFLRGQKGIEAGEYDKYYVFIVAPRKYLMQNAEAKKYPNRIDYETILTYFEGLDDERAEFKIQQIKQAINKQKKGYQVECDPAVTGFWHEYRDFQKKHYSGLYLIYNGEDKGANATWPRFNTVIDGLYMYHKTETGYVDLTFDGCSERIVELEKILTDTVGDYIRKGFTVQRTGKSAAIRVLVPILDLHRSFAAQMEDVEKCFEAVRKLSDLVKQFDQKSILWLIKN